MMETRATRLRTAVFAVFVVHIATMWAPASAFCPRLAALHAEPTLDLEELETRLRQTDAIGFFTKLELKSQVGGLLDDLRRFHRTDGELSLEELRERFNLLLLKLLTLLQDDDPGLSDDIATARPGLWTVLSDPQRFAEIEQG